MTNFGSQSSHNGKTQDKTATDNCTKTALKSTTIGMNKEVTELYIILLNNCLKAATKYYNSLELEKNKSTVADPKINYLQEMDICRNKIKIYHMLVRLMK